MGACAYGPPLVSIPVHKLSLLRKTCQPHFSFKIFPPQMDETKERATLILYND